MEREIFYLLSGILGIFGLILIVLIVKIIQMGNDKKNVSLELERLERMNRSDSAQLRQELGDSLLRFNDSVRKSLEERLDVMRSENTTQLNQMRSTVDEKLQDTLQKRITESFSLVSERLEKVHRELGEMQSLASDVGGLKRVLSNVKTRGTWGEVQLGALLEQMLAPDQFVKNAHIKENVQEVVEYAVKLPDGNVLIPIDSKFPIEDYERLITASENNDTIGIETATNELERRIRSEAKRIADKYIYPPVTTDFAIMFLPTEGLYAEIMRKSGLAAEIQSKYRISVAGPSTLGAFLNSLQMGFRTLAIQKRSGEVWRLLNETKTEFGKYADWTDKIRKNIEAALKVVDEAQTRTRAVNRKLDKLDTIDEFKTSVENVSVGAVPEELSAPVLTDRLI